MPSLSVVRAVLIALCLWLGAIAVHAQETVGINTAAWESLATRGEAAVDDPDQTEDQLTQLRTRIVSFRAEFDAARGANSGRIASLREQIQALGEPPAEGDTAEPEAIAIAAKRAELSQQLSEALAPVQVAEAAFRRADVLVGQIDTLLRERQTNKLLSAGASPLNPAHWPGAVSALTVSIGELWSSGIDSTAADNRDNLPLIFGASLLGLLLIARGRRWAMSIVEKLRRSGARGLGIWRFVVSLLRIVIPVIGLSILCLALSQIDTLSANASALLQIIPIMGAVLLGFRWVSERVFSRDDDEAMFLMSLEKRRSARWLIYALTVGIIIQILIRQLLSGRDMSETSMVVLLFPVVLLMSLVLFQLSRLLRGYEETDDTPADPSSDQQRTRSFVRVVHGFGNVGVAIAVLAPLLHAAGYYNASEQMLVPFITTLILLGLILVLQRFLADVYGALTGMGVQARDALMPVLFGIILLLLALPVLALTWGARLTDLTEIWGIFTRGFAIGNSRISPTDFVAFALIFAIGYVITRMVQGAMRNNVLPKTKMDIGGQNAIVSGLGYVGIFLAALAAITGAGIDLSSLAIVAGALSVGIGFGLQNIVSNFVSGIILLIERPISEGDWIEVSGGQMGFVRDISVRSTRIETFDRTDVIVPNADLVSGTVTNYTRGNTVGRVIVAVGVAYGTDPRKVERILTEIAESQPMVLASPAPAILFVNFGADALEFEMRMFLRDVTWIMRVKNDVNHLIAERFAAEGIEIPFAQRDLWLRNPEVLNGKADT